MECGLTSLILFCFNVPNTQSCIPIGDIFGGNLLYQPWNVAGHAIPLAFIYVFHKKKFEYPLAGLLLSTAVMDSPLWGGIRLLRSASLWCAHPSPPVCTFYEWVFYYYNPIGGYLVWSSPFFFPNFPSAALMCWSLVGRFVACGFLMLLQRRIEGLKYRKLVDELGESPDTKVFARTSLLSVLDKRRSRALRTTSKALRKLAAEE
jgi:hypothetical protein